MYKPEFEGPIKGYVMNYLEREMWRLVGTHEHGDLMQEAYCIFMRVEKRYPGVNAPHFMSLFKTIWGNHFTDLTIANSRQREHEVVYGCVGDALPIGPERRQHHMEVAGETDNDGLLAVMVRQAPNEVRLVLSLFLNAPQELLDLALGAWKGTADRRCANGGSSHINRLLGFPKEFDSIKAVTDYFKS